MWQQFTYTDAAGKRPYAVYTPIKYQVGEAVPLIVMLHGCTQTPADFAAGTRMNQIADQFNAIVVYPQQISQCNRNCCWNWFQVEQHYRSSGEPTHIAGIVHAIQQDDTRWTIDLQRIYVAGFSAGGAMASIIGACYPDIFAAIGVHSGMAYRAATSLSNSLKAMRQGSADPQQQGRWAYDTMGSQARAVPTIVIHGSRDYVVASINSEQVTQQWMHTNMLASGGHYQANFAQPTKVVQGKVPGGRAYTIYTWTDADGRDMQEHWKIDGMRHAWSGGSSTGSYTDMQGPDASLAMYTFFARHPLPSREKDHKHTFWDALRQVFGPPKR